MNSHEIDYQIFGDDMQIVSVELDPQETVIAEAGAMNWMDQNIEFETKMGDGSNPAKGLFGKLLDAGKRAISGESVFLTHFTNHGSNKQQVAFAGPYPGKIVPLNLRDVGGEIWCQRGAFLCAALGTSLSVIFTQRLSSGAFGGEGFILQKITGDGMAFLHAGGTIVKKELQGETIKIDTGCIVGFTPGLDYKIETAGNLKSMFFGGEGLFLATIQGTGTVFLQSLPFGRLVHRIASQIPSKNSG